MRKELADLGRESRHTFSATFERFGLKSAFKGPPLTTLMFKDVKCEEKIVADHIWFTMTKGFEACNLKPGDVVKFDGRVTSYYKGYMGYREDIEFYRPIEKDFKIERPTKISVIKRA